MKKEFFAGILLAAIITAAFINIRCLSRLISDITYLIDSSVESIESGDWLGAIDKTEDAAEIWLRSDSYTHIVLKHSEINTATQALYGLLSGLYSENRGEALGAAKLTSEFFKSLVSIERIRFGSIF